MLAALLPAVRAALLVQTHGGQPVMAPSNLAVQPIQFAATDRVKLSGWLIGHDVRHPSIVLVPGFKADRTSMTPYARFLLPHYNVLLYDSRGTGLSDGNFTAGPREVDDVLGAARFLQRQLPGSSVGVLGVSLGAGVALVAASRDTHIDAVVADSAYTDQDVFLSGLNHVHVGPIQIPLVPTAAWTIDLIGHVRIEHFRPIDSIGHIAPRPILLIHARHDANPTTPLSGALQLKAAAGSGTSLWIAPRGGHAGALAAQPEAYTSHVLSFFARTLK